MAIYHLHVDIVSRKTGRSSVAAAAYRAGEKLHNERDGITHDYTRKSGVVHSEIILPKNAPLEYKDRSILWNAIEKSEKRRDAQTAREIDIALPVEFDRQEQVETLHGYIQKNFTAHGMCADFAIHDKGDGNPHAHILLTTRNVNQSGFGDKNREWNKTDFLEQWRENWASVCNKRLQAKGLDERIDHRTLEAQGIDREPTIHIGATAKAIELAGRNSDRMREYREILAQNKTPSPGATAEYMHELKQGYVILDREISAIKQETADIRQKINTCRYKAEEITERAEHIRTMRKRIEGLKTQRQEMETFASKKTIDEQIQRLKHSHEQAANYFERNYHISPDEATAEMIRLEYKAKDMERIQDRLQDKLAPLEADKEIFTLEYQRQKLLAEISPDGQKIQDELIQLAKENRSPVQSTQDRIVRTQSERTLDIVTERNFQEILKDVSTDQAEALIKRREREREQKRTRGFNRGHQF